MAMVGVGGYAAKMVDVSSTALSLSDMLFTEEEIKSADTVHVSVRVGNVSYWYDGTVPTATQGHEILEKSERIIRGIRNIRNFKVISQSGTAKLAITLGTFNRTPS